MLFKLLNIEDGEDSTLDNIKINMYILDITNEFFNFHKLSL